MRVWLYSFQAEPEILTIQPSSLLQQCIQSMRSNLGNCATNDWNCRCTRSTNVVDCYTNCPEDPSKKDDETTRQKNCANAKAHALASTTASTSTVSSSRAAATSTDIDDGTDISDSEVENDLGEGDMIKSYSGLEANSNVRPGEGAASGLRTGGRFGFLGLALAFLF
ncbi:unnamed protein product [Penicillium nalgiovense]|uniref:Uncharacterized protein n=1 Tax=Penicillium nalgiovense TaxID=60175 RepID=A0A9W4HIQ6_PENNA|nr:unnamed protein product [Penicillium nalgiovense]CAG8029411.1 unnamed protein product [Penicillium nalgiovense]CAG8040110.1 unnamed protein product [Penicillium nalgiovense]CAG8040800.1 unnamed protein product [Penicillium nalgiovense]CAG8073829.1 unnamed protein product [Penicillium nalgiovense]